MMQYIFRNIRRSWIKSCIAAVVSAALLIALGQFIVVWQNTYVMFKNIPVRATFFEITTFQAELIENTGLVRDSYLAFQSEVYLDKVPPFWASPSHFIRGIPCQFVVTNDIERFADMDVHIEFEPGFDLERFMAGGGLYAIIGELLFVGGTEEWTHPPFEFGDQIQLARFIPGEHARYFRVVGWVRTFDEHEHALHSYIFVPRGRSYNIMFPIPPGGRREYDFAEFTIIDNTQIEQFRERLNRMGIMDYQYIMDTTTIDRIGNNLQIFQMLFPVITGVLALITGLIPLLMILQSAKEAALLRALGTAKSRTRLMIAGQYIITCITGLIIGIIAVLAYNGTQIIFDTINLFITHAAFFAICIMLGSIAGVIKITYSQVLALLQVRE